MTIRARQGIARAEQDKKSFSEQDKARNDRQMHDGKAQQGLWWACPAFI
jgi:hypothetical protein